MLRTLHQIGAEWIPLHVAQHREQMVVVLNGESLEATLPNVAARMIVAVIAADTSAEEQEKLQCPLFCPGNLPGHEIEYPMAVVILGGLVTSTLLNLFLLPPLYAAWGHRATANDTSVIST